MSVVVLFLVVLGTFASISTANTTMFRKTIWHQALIIKTSASYLWKQWPWFIVGFCEINTIGINELMFMIIANGWIHSILCTRFFLSPTVICVCVCLRTFFSIYSRINCCSTTDYGSHCSSFDTIPHFIRMSSKFGSMNLCCTISNFQWTV